MNPREYSFDILKRVILEEGYASLLLRKKTDFSPEDQSLVSELVYGVLRHYSFLMYQWKDLVNKRVKSNNEILLNLGCYQLLFLDRIPSYAAINETVSLANKHDKGFINAILHKVSERGRIPVQETNEMKKIAIETSHPEWILKMWEAHYGKDKMEEIARFNNTRGNVYGRINTLKCTKEEFQEDQNVHMINDVAFQYNGNLVETDWFQKGKVLIQDLSSQKVVEFMGVKEGMTIMDCCSAPGTKTQYIGMLLNHKGSLFASDIYESRMKLVEKLMIDTGVDNCICFTRDACIEKEDLPLCDIVLLDVPCSGLGDLRHKPEIKLHIIPESIDTLVQIQKRILEVNSNYCKVGGCLVYSTCTLNKKENEVQIQQFLNSHDNYSLEEDKTIFPMEYNSDGFYMARLRRNS